MQDPQLIVTFKENVLPKSSRVTHLGSGKHNTPLPHLTY